MQESKAVRVASGDNTVPDSDDDDDDDDDDVSVPAILHGQTVAGETGR